MQPLDLSFFLEQYHCALQYDHSSALDSAAAANALFLLNSHIALRYMAWCLSPPFQYQLHNHYSAFGLATATILHAKPAQ